MGLSEALHCVRIILLTKLIHIPTKQSDLFIYLFFNRFMKKYLRRVFPGVFFNRYLTGASKSNLKLSVSKTTLSQQLPEILLHTSGCHCLMNTSTFGYTSCL